MIGTMIGTFQLQAVAQACAVRIVDCLVGGTLVGFLTAAVLKISPRRSSALRFTVWFSALLAIASLPLLSIVLSTVLRSQSKSLLQGGISRPAVTLPGSWAFYLFDAWVMIAVWGLIRLGISLWQMRALRRSCVAIDPAEMQPRLRAMLNRNRVVRSFALCTSNRVQVPTALGLMAPAVVVPQWLMAELSPEELNLIVLHEVAHLRRWDDWTNLAQKIIRAVFFFHPAVWWIEKQLSMEREMACDDAVLANTAAPRAYAQCLARLAEKSLVRRTLALAQAGLGPARQTFQRVAQILDANQPRGTKHGWKWALPLVAALAVSSAVLASKRPQLIAFESARVGSAQVVPANPAMAAVDSDAIPALSPVLTGTGKHPARNHSQRRSPYVMQAKNIVPASNSRASATSAPANIGELQNSFVLETVIAEPSPVHSTPAGAVPVTSTETILLVVRQGANNSRQPVYEIQWWRLTVLRSTPRDTTAPTGGEIPKKT